MDYSKPIPNISRSIFHYFCMQSGRCKFIKLIPVLIWILMKWQHYSLTLVFVKNKSFRIGTIIMKQHDEPQYPVISKAVRSATYKKKHKRNSELWNIIKFRIFMMTLKDAPGPEVIEMNKKTK